MGLSVCATKVLAQGWQEQVKVKFDVPNCRSAAFSTRRKPDGESPSSPSLTRTGTKELQGVFLPGDSSSFRIYPSIPAQRRTPLAGLTGCVDAVYAP